MALRPGIAWITGGGTGIGRALALALARGGWRVAISGRRPEPLAETVAALGAAPGRIFAYPADVTDAAALAAVVARIEAELGALDLAVLNAGVWRPIKLEAFDATVLHDAMRTNHGGVVNALGALLPRFIARRAGHVAIVASVAGYLGLPLAVAYGPTKAALINLAESLHLGLRRHGVRVQVVNPGFVATPLTAANRFPMPGLMSADAAAARIVAGLGSSGFEIAFPRRLVWVLKLLRLLPYPLQLRALRALTRR